MLGHYLTIALRNFARHRLHTAVSLVVLTLGLTCFVAAYLVVGYLRSYDNHFANADRAYVVFQGMYGPKVGLDWPSYPASSLLLSEQLALDAPELDAVARYRTIGRAFVTVDGERKPRRIAAAEPKFVDIFDFDVVTGSLSGALTGRNAIITASAADALFGTRDVAGRTVTVTEGSSTDVTIAAVIADLPQSSHLSSTGLRSSGFEMLLSWDAAEQTSPLPAGGWFNTMVFTYALLPSDRSLTLGELNRRLAEVVTKHVPDEGIEVNWRARPVSDITTGLMQSQLQGFQGSAWGVDIFTLLQLFAAVVLAVACVNFVNLATARAAGRAREIGVRKAIGAAAPQVVRQELFQTGIVALAAVLLALGAFAALRELVRGPWRQAFAIPWGEPWFFMFLAVLVLVVTLLSGLYPALVLASVRPVTALRAGTMRAGSRIFRTLLVGSQFALASFLLVAVVVVFSQRGNLREALLGRFTDPYVVVLPQPIAPNAESQDVITTELLKGPGIKSVTSASSNPWQFAGNQLQVTKTPGEDQPRVPMEQVFVGHDYLSVMEVPLVAGRVFSRDRNDALAMTPEQRQANPGPYATVVDRDAARALGWPNPTDALGQVVYRFGRAEGALEIIGVVETVPLAIRDRGSQGVGYVMSPASTGFTIVRIAKDDVDAALAHIDGVFKALSTTGAGRQRLFLDQMFENQYFTFAMINRVFVMLGAFAVAIAAVGLFGMASYMTARRTREIGLRKTQGASAAQILRLLLWDFGKPVLIANLLVWPFAFVAARRYLDVFAEPMALTPLPFAIALGGTLLVAGLAVSGRVVRAARIRPTEALREE